MRRPEQLVGTLHVIARKYAPTLGVIAVWYLHPRWTLPLNETADNRTIFFGPEFPGGQFWADYLKRAAASGRSALNDYGRRKNAPFTLTEAMQTLRLTGEARWVFDLLRDYGVRDGLYCPYRRWIVLFSSEEPLELDPVDRRMLHMAGGVATEHLDRLMVKRGQPIEEDRPVLTERELEVLRLRALGKKAAEIARILGIKPLTARNHLENILKKLEAADMVDAVTRAIRHGLLRGGI